MVLVDDGRITRVARAALDSEAVREGALSVFARLGYHGASVGAVADALGVRAPTLYNHMTSKEGVLEEIVLSTAEAVWSEFETAVQSAERPEGRLRAAVHAYALRHATHPREALVVNRDAASLSEPARGRALELLRRHENGVRGLISDGVASGHFRTSRPAMVSFGILEMCVSIAKWYREGGPLDAEAVADSYAEYALRMAGATAPWRGPTKG